MKKCSWVILAVTVSLAGCANTRHGAIPVVDSGVPLSEHSGAPAKNVLSIPTAEAIPQDSGVVVMVPGGAPSMPIQSFPASEGAGTGYQTESPAPLYSSSPTPQFSSPSGIPSGSLSADEQLDGPVLALLTTAQQQQGGGDLNGAASSLERAQRIAPREPQVLYRLAEVRMSQGDAAQAEQLARRGLSYTSGRPALEASLWGLIAQAREKQGDAAGAALARQKAKVSL